MKEENKFIIKVDSACKEQASKLLDTLDKESNGQISPLIDFLKGLFDIEIKVKNDENM